MNVSEAVLVVCAPDPSLGSDSFKYRAAISSIAVSDAAGSSVIARLVSQLIETGNNAIQQILISGFNRRIYIIKLLLTRYYY